MVYRGNCRWGSLEVGYSKEIGKALDFYGYYTFNKMEELFSAKTPIPEVKEEFRVLGDVVARIEKRSIDDAVKYNILCNFKGYRVRLSTCEPRFSSEVGGLLAAKGCDFAVVCRYAFKKDVWKISARGCFYIPLDKVFAMYGGHPNAAGFTIHGYNSLAWQQCPYNPKKCLGLCAIILYRIASISILLSYISFLDAC